jgi:hypothetical protein
LRIGREIIKRKTLTAAAYGELVTITIRRKVVKKNVKFNFVYKTTAVYVFINQVGESLKTSGKKKIHNSFK